MSAKDAAKAIALGISSACPTAECILAPIADGGEGTLDAFIESCGGEILTVITENALGGKIISRYGILADGRTAIVEMAEASGLRLIPPGIRRALDASTYGTGILIKDALARGFREIILAIGGSATTDGGAGALEALGIKFLTKEGIPVPRGGGGLANLCRIDATGLMHEARESNFTVACDVDNPLLGENGSAFIFSPQKGASGAEVCQLNSSLKNFAEVVRSKTATDIATFPGSGAAGGIAAGLSAFLNCRLERGFELVSRMLGLEDKIRGVQLVLTGEGTIDETTLNGKAPAGIAKMAKKHSVPLIAFAGRVAISDQELKERGFSRTFVIMPESCSLDEALKRGKDLLCAAAFQAMNHFLERGNN